MTPLSSIEEGSEDSEDKANIQVSLKWDKNNKAENTEKKTKKGTKAYKGKKAFKPKKKEAPSSEKKEPRDLKEESKEETKEEKKEKKDKSKSKSKSKKSLSRQDTSKVPPLNQISQMLPHTPQIQANPALNTQLFLLKLQQFQHYQNLQKAQAQNAQNAQNIQNGQNGQNGTPTLSTPFMNNRQPPTSIPDFLRRNILATLSPPTPQIPSASNKTIQEILQRIHHHKVKLLGVKERQKKCYEDALSNM
eukprot:CAMPEP_0197018192 /NCGR_PEP_ID=MMETSP1380-20130617/79965_1 /TAXON_ID=5936 /ORGANISM="Euplotes crassus, Strain CT5" /LENGTH=247 /DNA_ID=CAMNT_0042445383 /DNA_START=82 /DNA_END=825 /DNA_ORIENTATION=+